MASVKDFFSLQNKQEYKTEVVTITAIKLVQTQWEFDLISCAHNCSKMHKKMISGKIKSKPVNLVSPAQQKTFAAVKI